MPVWCEQRAYIDLHRAFYTYCMDWLSYNNAGFPPCNCAASYSRLEVVRVTYLSFYSKPSVNVSSADVPSLEGTMPKMPRNCCRRMHLECVVRQNGRGLQDFLNNTHGHAN